ncbi:type-F conjugative transfer system pilin assembly thiol-disulfide isomerase TrbB [Legionella sp. WA2024007413]
MKGRMLIILMMLLSVSLSAANSDWLTTTIAAKEQGIKPQIFSQPQTQTQVFFKEHGLIFFYASSCPYCQQFAPILNSWATHNKIKVLPLAFDNQTLSEFPNFLPATTEWISAAYQENPIQYPALFVVNPKTKKLYPVGFGAMTHDELRGRLERLLPKIIAYERSGDMHD